MNKGLFESMFSTDFKRRINLIERLIEHLLPNMYPCDFYDEDDFVRGVVDEIYYLMSDELYGIHSLEFSDISDFIFQYKSDELLDYYRERCEMTNLDEQTTRMKVMMGLNENRLSNK